MLADFPDDPRISKAIATWALDPPTTSSSTYPFWTKALARTATIGDVRVLPLIQERLAKPKGGSQFWPKFYAALERLVPQLEALPQSSGSEHAIAALMRQVEGLSRARARSAATAAPREEVPQVEGTPLVQARIHLEASRIAPAIEAMLVAWRDTRVPAIADAIDRATRLLPSWEKPLGTSAKAVHEAWMRALRDDPAGAMPQLLQNVNIGGTSAAEQHVVELATLADDPRIALRLAAITRQPTISPQRAQYWKSLLEIIARARDVRTCEPVRRQFRDFTVTHLDHYRQARRILGDFVIDPSSVFSSWPLELVDARERKELDEVAAALGALEAKVDPTERQLIAAIAESWNDEGPRLVYADWLSERDHPRGELIVLATKKRRTGAETKRMAELAKAPYIHGALSDLGGLEVERGLPKTLSIAYWASSITWHAVVGHPLLGLLEHLTLESSAVAAIDDVARVLLHPETRRLERVTSNGYEREILDPLEPLVKERFRREGKALVRRS
jgi:uncharacterized protein (TIGR02996 family)